MLMAPDLMPLVTKVSVFFDAATAKHRLDFDLTEAVSVVQVVADDVEERIERTSGGANEGG